MSLSFSFSSRPSKGEKQRQHQNKWRFLTPELFSFGEADDDIEDILLKLEEADEQNAPDPIEVKNSKTETCIIFWSSGTTGSPKGICHSHFSAYYFAGFGKSLTEKNRPSVATTCFFHVGGFCTAIMAIEKRMTFHHVSYF